MGQPPPRPTPAATATPTATAASTATPDERSLKDCVDAAKKKKKECEDEADKRYDRCAAKCEKDFPIGSEKTEEDFLKRMACLGECAKTKIFDLFVCEAHYSRALEDCIKKHLAEGQK